MNQRERVKRPSGFTLIELLVVISIIGLLASVVLVSLNGARAKARNARRLADIKQLQTALELYYDTNVSLKIFPRSSPIFGAGEGVVGVAIASTPFSKTCMKSCVNACRARVALP